MAKLYIKKSDGAYVPQKLQSVTNIDVVQTTGNSVTAAMSQDAVTKELASKQGSISDLGAIREGAGKGNEAFSTVASIVEAGYVFAGVATLDPATDPGTPDAKVFYIANGKGTYTNFGSIEVTEDDVVILYYDTTWHKISTGIATEVGLSELENKLIGVTDFTFDFTEGSVSANSFRDVTYKTIPGHKYRIIVRTESDNITFFIFRSGSTFVERTSRGDRKRVIDYLCKQESDTVRMVYHVAGTPELYEVSIIDLTQVSFASLQSNEDVIKEAINGKTVVYRMATTGVGYDNFSLKKGSTITCTEGSIRTTRIEKPDGTSTFITKWPYRIPDDDYTILSVYNTNESIVQIEIYSPPVIPNFSFTDSPEFIKALVDSNGTLIYGIHKNGDIVLGAGVPNQVKEYVQTLLKSYEAGNALVNAESVRALMLHPYRKLVDKTTEFNYVVPFNEIDGLIVLE